MRYEEARLMRWIIERFFAPEPPEAPIEFQGTPPRRLFAVVSNGCAATHWLAKILNAHPEVLCVHNIKNPWSKQTKTDMIDHVVYMEILRRAGRGYRLAGDCHGIAARSIPAIRETFGDQFRSAVVTRHPIPRIVSYLSLSQKVGRDSYLKNPITHMRVKMSFEPQLRRLLNTRERRLFAYQAMPFVNFIKNQVEAGPVFTMEALTKNFEEVNKLVNFLSNGELEFTLEMLAPIFDTPVVAHRKKKAGPRDPEEIFASWPEWQRELFRTLLLPEAKQLYQDLGYDLTFIG
jgi:hypothetical protein